MDDQQFYQFAVPGLIGGQETGLSGLLFCVTNQSQSQRVTTAMIHPETKNPGGPPNDHQFYQFHQFHRWGAFSVILAAFLATSEL